MLQTEVLSKGHSSQMPEARQVWRPDVWLSEQGDVFNQAIPWLDFKATRCTDSSDRVSEAGQQIAECCQAASTAHGVILAVLPQRHGTCSSVQSKLVLRGEQPGQLLGPQAMGIPLGNANASHQCAGGRRGEPTP